MPEFDPFYKSHKASLRSSGQKFVLSLWAGVHNSFKEWILGSISLSYILTAKDEFFHFTELVFYVVK